MSRIQLTPNQKEALNIENHICVTAGAGSGKTAVLVDRYLQILKQRSDVKPDQIVAISFTDKAAAEMKGRIIENLGEPENAEIRDKHLEEMYTAPISTIHSFCSRILRENPFQAAVPANFGILENIEKKLLLKQTIKDTLQEIATNTQDRHRTELKCCLESLLDREKLVDILTSMVDKREIIQHLLETVYTDSTEERLPKKWEKAFQGYLPSEAEVDEFIKCLTAVLQMSRGKNTGRVDFLISDFKLLQDLKASSPEVLIYLREISKLITTKANEIAKKDFIGNKNDISDYEDEVRFLVSVATRIKEAPDIDCDDVESDDYLLLSTTYDLLALYKRILEDYQKAKLSQSKLDFTDLQIKTRDLLKNNDGIRRKLLAQYKFYMIDEYQDTNELQYELVMLLTENLKSSNLFIVGDPKQSIYGFRDADVRVFEKTKQRIIENDGKDIKLTENFRSLQNSVGFVNYLFTELMGNEKESDFEVTYEPLNVAKLDNTEGVVEIILGQKDSEMANEYTLIAQHILNLVKGSEQNSGLDSKKADAKNSISYGDIAILIRARGHLPEIEHALHSAGIPYLTSGGIGFYQRQEIYDIWNYLNFLNAPNDNGVSLIGILRGPAFGISDTEIFEISLQKGKNFWFKARNYQRKTDRLSTAIEILDIHNDIAHRMPVNQLIHTVVNETGMIGTLKTGSKGEQRWANYEKLLDIARNFDADDNKQTLADFIEYLDVLITDEPREGDAPIEEGSDSIKIMTIHAAKGKEFPVVILPCLNRKGPNQQEPFIDENIGIGFSPLMQNQDYDKSAPQIVRMMKETAKAKDDAEKKRILYVATTRAEERLILSGTLNDKNNPEYTLKMLFEQLDISIEAEFTAISGSLYLYKDGKLDKQDFQLKIPIIKQLDSVSDEDSDSVETTEVSQPEAPFEDLVPSEFKSSFTVDELANFARCPLRYQLENVLRLAPINGGMTKDDNSDLDTSIQVILSRVERRLNAVEIDNRIDRVLEKFPEITNDMTEQAVRKTIRQQVDNFLESELADNILNAFEPTFNQQIHAKVNGHIISGRFNKLFQDQSGNWHIIDFKTSHIIDPGSCQPEMQLLALLFLKRNPSETKVTITFYFTGMNEFVQICFNRTELQETIDSWHGRIKDMQKGAKRKNLEHCYTCPYADPGDQCIVKDS